ncbi:metalloprotease [Candidatus Woesearchaeota archaeon]|nr:metalloprotease [Candidatus Woesearchaeota archaeon]
MQIKFSRIEIRDLSRAWFFVSIAFAIVLSGGIFGIGQAHFLQSFIIAAIAVGTGFLLHEMGHKIVAQRYGCFAEFRADMSMLILAVFISFLGFVFAAPGAVMIMGHVSKEKYGKISLAGPLVNIVLALLFLAAFVFLSPLGLLGNIFSYGFIINTWLALFNMLPFWVLDGKKVLAWSRTVYFCTIGFAVLLLILGYVLPLGL